MLDSWDISSATWGTREGEHLAEANTPKSGAHRRKLELFEIPEKTIYRRAYGVEQMVNSLNYERLKKGHSYHIMTSGKCDALSFLKLVLLNYKKLDYLLISSWVISGEDILQLEEWLTDGTLSKVDFYLGEIYSKQYSVEWQMLNGLMHKTNCGRIKVFKNHAKILAGWGGENYFTIECSANLNTNPRNEQAVITIDKGLCEFYKKYYDEIQ